MGIRIIVDSTADMRPEVAEKVGIVPLTVHFGDKEYISGVNINPKKFYEMLVESDELPTTSQPTPVAFEEAFEKAVEAGHEVVCLTCSGKLSGTCQSANIAAAEFSGKVHVTLTELRELLFHFRCISSCCRVGNLIQKVCHLGQR